MRLQDVLAEAVLVSRVSMRRFFAGFDDTNHTRQAPNLPNHFAWTMGHLAAICSRSAGHFDGRPLPESDFAENDPTSRFDPKKVGFGSTPIADASQYPSCARCIEIFDRAIDRLASAARNVDDAKLEVMIKGGPYDAPLWMYAIRMTNHNGVHQGQLMDLRRAVGLPPVIAMPPRK